MTFEMILAFAIVFVAVYGMCLSENIIKSIICFNMIQAAIILLFVLIAEKNGNQIPIVSDQIGKMVDPLPHALMITAIVISASITALALMFVIKIFHYYGTLNWHELAQKDVKK